MKDGKAAPADASDLTNVTSGMPQPMRAEAAVVEALAGFSPISLSALDAGSSLQQRVDHKYLVPIEEFSRFAEAISEDHVALEIDEDRVFPYESVYFDTPDLDCFNDHVNGRLPRAKIRIRCYVATGACYLEVKIARRTGETVKHSVECGTSDKVELSASGRRFVDGALHELPSVDTTNTLQPGLTTLFRRGTIGARRGGERVTCDTHLLLVARDRGAVRFRDDHVLVETKSENGEGRADRLLASLGLAPVSLSKYRVGIGLLVAHDPDPEDKSRYRPESRLELSVLEG